MVKKFIWKDKYSVKVGSLDKQHKKFFELTNDMIDLLEKPHTSIVKEQLTIALIKFGRYAQYHLDFEEDCFNRYNCPGCTAHTSAHDMYREKVKVFLHQIQQENTDTFKLAEEVAKFSQQWLSNHILRTDKGYTKCLEDKNID